MFYGKGDKIYITSFKKTKIAAFVLAVGLSIFVLGISSVSFAFESASSVRLTAEYIMAENDSNGDGVFDFWYQSYGLDPNDPEVGSYDGDNDGITNREEYFLGTDPTVSNSGIEAILKASPSSGSQPLEVDFYATGHPADVNGDGVVNIFDMALVGLNVGRPGNGQPLDTPLADVNGDGTVDEDDLAIIGKYYGHSYSVVRYEWDFDGNGTYDLWSYASEGNTAKYKYTASGSYNVKLRVTDSMGNTGIAAAPVNVSRNEALSPPTATPELNFINISIPKTQKLNATASDNKGITRYQWDTTGNGEYDISLDKSANITKTYNETITKSFNARLKVTDTDGLSDIATVGIMTDATKWYKLPDSPYRPKAFLNEYIVYGTAGVPVSLGGYGMPQMGNAYGYAKKLEWDFEGDGIYDWSSVIENNDWKGRADVTHTYGAPGIYRAVLKVHTEANLSAYDSVLVIISASTTPPTAKATVDYNSTFDAPAIDEAVPIKATFKHSQSSGSIVKYQWDFDGDKNTDYCTDSSTATPTYDYKYPGYYVACLRVIDINGLTDTFYIPVFAYYPVTYSSHISLPSEGQTVAGNAITLTCNVFPDDAGVKSVKFQHRKEGDLLWTDIGLGVPITSYIKTWDTTKLVNGAAYQLRAIVNGEDSTSFKITSVKVDNLTASPDIYEYKNATHIKRVIVDPDKENLIVLPDGTRIFVPYSAMPKNGTPPQVTIEEIIGPSAGVGNSIDITITGIDKFLKDITILIPYPDANNDGIVDGTGIDENTLVIKWYNPDTKEWEPIYDSVVYPDENYVSARINHLSLFGVGPLVASAAAAGASSAAASPGETLSYCFIATAAYGTPMAEDVVTLRAFRDRHLMRNDLGRKFVRGYYRYSPPIAEFISNKPGLKTIVRFLLKPLVKIAKEMMK